MVLIVIIITHCKRKGPDPRTTAINQPLIKRKETGSFKEFSNGGSPLSDTNSTNQLSPLLLLERERETVRRKGEIHLVLRRIKLKTARGQESLPTQGQNGWKMTNMRTLTGHGIFWVIFRGGLVYHTSSFGCSV